MQTLNTTFFLLSFNPQKLTFASWYYYTKFGYGLCGALLCELLLSGKIILSEQQEFVVNQAIKPSEDWIEDLFKTIEERNWFTILLGAKHEKTIASWFKVLRMELHDIKEHTQKTLQEKGIIGKKPIKLLGLKLSSNTVLQNTDAYHSLKDRLENVILGKISPDLQTIMLLRLVKAVKIVDDIFAEKSIAERQILTHAIDQLCEKEEFSNTIKLIFKELQQGKIDEMTDMLDTLADTISEIGDVVGEGADSGGDGDGGSD
jgi:hypothetical protein